MRLSAKTFAAMLMCLALAAFQFDSYAQSRSNSRSASTSRSSSASRSTSGSVSRPESKPSTKGNQSVSRPVQKPSKDKPAVDKPSVNRPKPDISPADRKPADKPQVRPQQPKPQTKPSVKPQNRPGNQHRPVQINRPQPHPRADRVHPRDRGFLDFHKPSFHWANDPHYYGYRVKVLPVQAHRHLFGGVVYYSYDNVWYRRYNGYYVVCRPPFGTSIAADLVTGLAWTAVNIAYYNTVSNTYDQISENNAYIAQQNAVIAQNNATIAAQNQTIAQSQTKAQIAYGLANELGLIQSYADAGTSYFYQDGVFYTMGADGQYYVIVPPAGALVENLPEDFEKIILNGKEYYRVDDTVYQMTISDGKPYFEVLGQMNQIL